MIVWHQACFTSHGSILTQKSLLYRSMWHIFDWRDSVTKFCYDYIVNYIFVMAIALIMLCAPSQIGIHYYTKQNVKRLWICSSEFDTKIYFVTLCVAKMNHEWPQEVNTISPTFKKTLPVLVLREWGTSLLLFYSL